MLKKLKIAAIALLLPLLAFAQSYPSPTYQNVTVLGTLTAATPAFTNPVPVSSGGTNCSAASGTCLDNITGFASTGFLTRTGSGTYAFQSLTNGITYANLAQAGANTLIGNATGSTANVTAITVTGCNGAAQALQWTNGSGFGCNSNVATSGANSNITSLSGLSTPLSVSQGGTGGSSLAQYQILAGSGTGAITTVGSGSSSQVLTSNGASAYPTFQAIPSQSGRLIGVQRFTSGGTYTPTTGTNSVIVEVVGGGGGGGGAAANNGNGGGGGAGAYARVRFTSSFSGVTVTIGAAGTAATAGANTGGSGGTTSFGALVSCPGGGGGAGSSNSTTAQVTTAGAGGAAPTISGGTVFVTTMGQTGGQGLVAANGEIGGPGASSLMGAGGGPTISSGATSSTGNAGGGNGAGGGGGSAGSTGAAAAGGAGSQGVVVVWEFS